MNKKTPLEIPPEKIRHDNNPDKAPKIPEAEPSESNPRNPKEDAMDDSTDKNK